jgi:hypothetical protein
MFLDQFKTYDASGWAGTCGLVREAADSLANNTKRYFVTIQPAQISERHGNDQPPTANAWGWGPSDQA